MRTAIYVDGFNLYYRGLKNTPYKWLDLGALFKALLPDKHNIVDIKYYTARVRSFSGETGVQLRQKAYLEAIKAYVPNLSICYGHFRHTK